MPLWTSGQITKRHALAETRRLKPGLPLLGLKGIPLRDELALERHLAAPA